MSQQEFDYQTRGLEPNMIFGNSCMSGNGKNVLAMRHAQLNWFWPPFLPPSCFSDISVRYHNFGPNYRFYFIFNKLTVCHEAFEKKKSWVSTTAILSAILFFFEKHIFQHNFETGDPNFIKFLPHIACCSVPNRTVLWSNRKETVTLVLILNSHVSNLSAAIRCNWFGC